MASATPAPVSGKGSSEKRVALVTGASTGIGAAICRELVKHDMIVVGCAREVHRIERIANELRAGGRGDLVAVRCDLANKEDITALFDQIRGRWNRLDVCVNNAGFATDTPLTSGESEMWRNMLKVNILGLSICTRESIKLMTDNKIDGLIIQVGCVMGHRVPEIPKDFPDPPNFGFYYGTKFMVRGLAESLRHELLRAKSNIRVALISPGAVKTEMYERGFKQDAAQLFYGNVECLQPEDIARAVNYIIRVPPNVNVQDIIVQPTQYSLTS